MSEVEFVTAESQSGNLIESMGATGVEVRVIDAKPPTQPVPEPGPSNPIPNQVQKSNLDKLVEYFDSGSKTKLGSSSKLDNNALRQMKQFITRKVIFITYNL